MHLDRSECVKSWSLRLGIGERGIRINEVRFVDDEDGGLSDEDSDGEPSGRRRVAITREKLRSRDREKDKENKAAPKEKAEVLVKVNGNVLKASGGAKAQTEEWATDLVVGSNVVEVMGDKGGEPWRLYLERQPGT